MMLVNQGEPDHPWGEPSGMTKAPMIHPTAFVRNSLLGDWTVLGPNNHLVDSSLDDYSYTSRDCDINNATIGKFANIASGVRLNPTNHPTWRASLHHFTYRSNSHHLNVEDDTEFFAWRRAHLVEIGHDVWIGHRATIMPGVRVGTGAVVGAGAIVTHDIAPYMIAVGVPARPLKRRFEAPIADAMQEIAWWDWQKDELAHALPDFRSLSAEAFIEKYRASGSAKR